MSADQLSELHTEILTKLEDVKNESGPEAEKLRAILNQLRSLVMETVSMRLKDTKKAVETMRTQPDRTTELSRLAAMPYVSESPRPLSAPPIQQLVVSRDVGLKPTASYVDFERAVNSTGKDTFGQRIWSGLQYLNYWLSGKVESISAGGGFFASIFRFFGMDRRSVVYKAKIDRAIAQNYQPRPIIPDAPIAPPPVPTRPQTQTGTPPKIEPAPLPRRPPIELKDIPTQEFSNENFTKFLRGEAIKVAGHDVSLGNGSTLMKIDGTGYSCSAFNVEPLTVFQSIAIGLVRLNGEFLKTQLKEFDLTFTADSIVATRKRDGLQRVINIGDAKSFIKDTINLHRGGGASATMKISFIEKPKAGGEERKTLTATLAK